ncbi:MAG: DNA replication protein DnaC [Ruminococcaceae bacterium]|nr:DNA replication protein DnaC [Oscillospiraceae bacterium]
MRYENAVIKKINDIYEDLKREREEDAQRRKNEIYKKFPRIEEIDDEIAVSALKVASKIADGNHSVEELSKELMETLKTLKTEKGEIYKANNIPYDYTDEKFKCEKCKDTGYIKGERCRCFLEYLAKSVYELSNIPQSAKDETFDKFDFSYYSKNIDPKIGISHFDNVKSVYDSCISFCENFEKTNENLYIYGNAGVGKTFLTNCIAQDLISKGHNVLYQTAYKTFSFLDDYKFGKIDRESNQFLFDLIYDCDLLIIDDLGTEFNTQYTQAAFFDILNTRINEGKKTIISTNLSFEELRDMYSPRTASRIAGVFTLLHIFGEDIRIKKKLQG